MADFNLRALKVSQGENFVVHEGGAGDTPIKLALPAADGSHNIKVRVTTNPDEANFAALFFDDNTDNLVDALGGNLLVDDVGNILTAAGA